MTECTEYERVVLARMLIRLFVLKKQGFIIMDFDFERLKNLYMEDPDAFEVETRKMIVEVIESFPEESRDKFRAKQWRLEQDLNKIKNPLERMNKMVTLFWIQVAEFTDSQKTFGVPFKERTKDEPTKPCKVINFNKDDEKDR